MAGHDEAWLYKPPNPRHSQSFLLLVSLMWGTGYNVSEKLRIPFAEVFPPSVPEWSFITMRGWGILLIVFASLAMLSEYLMLRRQHWASFTLFFAHAVLAGVYSTLAAGAACTGLHQAHWEVASMLSGISRPMLWCMMAWLHTTYARLPPPPKPNGQRRQKTRFRFFVRVPVDG